MILKNQLANKEILLLLGLLIIISSQNLVPTSAFMKLATAFGFNCSMDQFIGREKSA